MVILALYRGSLQEEEASSLLPSLGIDAHDLGVLGWADPSPAVQETLNSFTILKVISPGLPCPPLGSPEQIPPQSQPNNTLEQLRLQCSKGMQFDLRPAQAHESSSERQNRRTDIAKKSVLISNGEQVANGAPCNDDSGPLDLPQNAALESEHQSGLQKGRKAPMAGQAMNSVEISKSQDMQSSAEPAKAASASRRLFLQHEVQRKTAQKVELVIQRGFEDCSGHAEALPQMVSPIPVPWRCKRKAQCCNADALPRVLRDRKYPQQDVAGKIIAGTSVRSGTDASRDSFPRPGMQLDVSSPSMGDPEEHTTVLNFEDGKDDQSLHTKATSPIPLHPQMTPAGESSAGGAPERGQLQGKYTGTSRACLAEPEIEKSPDGIPSSPGQDLTNSSMASDGSSKAPDWLSKEIIRLRREQITVSAIPMAGLGSDFVQQRILFPLLEDLHVKAKGRTPMIRAGLRHGR